MLDKFQRGPMDLFRSLAMQLGQKPGGTPARKHYALHERGMVCDRLRRTRDIRKHVPLIEGPPFKYMHASEKYREWLAEQ